MAYLSTGSVSKLVSWVRRYPLELSIWCQVYSVASTRITQPLQLGKKWSTCSQMIVDLTFLLYLVKENISINSGHEDFIMLSF